MKKGRVIIIVGLPIILFLLIMVVMELIKPYPPLGSPSDYFDKIKEIENSRVVVYVYSDEIDFYDDLAYTKISDFASLKTIKSDKSYLVLDALKLESSGMQNIDLFVKSLFTDNCMNFVILNNDLASSNNFSLIDDSIAKNPLTIVSSLDCGETVYTDTYDDRAPSLAILTYNIIEFIELDLEKKK